MKYPKIINLLDDTTNQPSKFKARNWVEINDESRETYDCNSDINFITSMIRSNQCDYSDAYIHVEATITVPNTAAQGAAVNSEVIFKNWTSFTNSISKINNTQVDDAQDIDIVMPMYNLLEYSDDYSSDNIIDFHAKTIIVFHAKVNSK